MHLEEGIELLGVRVVDAEGRRLGRLATAYFTAEPFAVVWLVVRLPGLPRRWRAIPAQDAEWANATQVRLRVTHRRAEVLASPPVDTDSLDTSSGRAPVDRFYRSSPAYVPC
jgi:hypothetical protein